MAMVNKEPTVQTDFDWRVRVYYEDTDAGGIVYYANYLRFFERARTEWLRAKRITATELAHDEGLQFVVRSMSVDYRFPARLDDELTLSLKCVQTRGASIVLDQQARCFDLARGVAISDVPGKARQVVACDGNQGF